MTEKWNLPTTIEISGKEYEIRTDYRAILDILMALNDPEIITADMTDDEIRWEKCRTMLFILYKNFEDIPPEDYQEAADKATDFIDMGIKDDGNKKYRIMDWEQDAAIIIPSVNRVIGTEIRTLDYLHWWTFLGAYMEIGQSLFSEIINIRQKRAKGKKLEKWEQDFYRANKDLIALKTKYTDAEKEEQERLKAILG